jgi:hypothetical protein
MKRIYLLFILVCLNLHAFTQITTEPAFPVAGQQVKIIFDSKQESRLGSFTGDLYAHTGVGIEGVGNWQNVIGTWGQNATQPKLTNKGNGIYELLISPSINSFYGIAAGQKVINMSFVFRSASPISGTTYAQTNDLLVTVYQSGLNLDLQFPTANAILKTGTSYTFNAITSSSATLKLYIDNLLVSTVNGDSIGYHVQYTDPGDHKVLVTAENSEGLLVSDSTYFCVMSTKLTASLPIGSRKGITYLTDHSARLVLFGPKKSYVFVLGDFNDWRPINSYQMKNDGDYFWIDLTGLQKGKEYAFQYFIDGELLIADPYTEKISDPWNDSSISSTTYPGLMAYPTGKTQGIASVLQTGQESYQWEVSDFSIPENKKLVIYELLVRDFTDEHSFQAVIKKLDYLSNLRINVLELMPVSEFEGNSSWGYNPSFYFAPDKYYGPKDDFKRLVDECHKRGIALVMDMVLNHSYGQSPLVRMYWDAANNRPSADNPWYNTVSPNTSYSWGYDFNHESSYTKEFVDSVNSFWMNQYHVDGFRFDFTKGFTNTPGDGSAYDASRIAILERMADEIWKRKPGALVICEHFAENSEEIELSNHGLMLWGNLNNSYCEAAMGYNENNKSDLSWGVYKQRSWSKPNLVTYQESHDEERVGYKCITWGNSTAGYDIKELPTALDRAGLNAVFHLPLPGPKMIWQFGELGYDFSIRTCDDGVTLDDGCRVSEKPIRWDYTENPDRVDLYRVMASLNYLKQNYDEFSNPDNFSYSLTGAQKSYTLASGNHYVVAIGNFALTESTMSVSFPAKGTWYNYFDQTTFEVTSDKMDITLQPGEYRLFSTRPLQHPEITGVGVKDLESSNSVQLFPNPTGKWLTISGDGIQKVELYTIEGRKVLIVYHSDNQQQKTINTGMLGNGYYFLKVYLPDGKTAVKKFCKSE